MADGTSIEQFMKLAPQLMTEAAEYAGSGEQKPETEAAIRQLKVMTAALMSALNAIRT